MAVEQSQDKDQGRRSVEKTTGTLNGFLRGEMSAVEAYRQALEKVGDASVRLQLQESARSHEDRAARLRNRIAQLGGKPSDTSGAWGSFARLVEGGAKVFGVKAVLAALEEGEDHGIRLYRDELDDLDPAERSFVMNDLLPEQQRTHDLMSGLKHSFH